MVAYLLYRYQLSLWKNNHLQVAFKRCSDVFRFVTNKLLLCPQPPPRLWTTRWTPPSHLRSATCPRCSRTATRTRPTSSSSRCRTEESVSRSHTHQHTHTSSPYWTPPPLPLDFSHILKNQCGFFFFCFYKIHVASSRSRPYQMTVARVFNLLLSFQFWPGGKPRVCSF